jgi:hypothetical protein
MIEIICEYCGFYMKFSGRSLKLNNFNYKCPICHTHCESNIKLHCPIEYMPPVKLTKGD